MPPACGSSIPLPVLPSPPTRASPPVKKSRNASRRALVLILIYILITIHLIQWLVVGMTISPIEPSESMYTLELGAINAGFIFFSLALFSTFVFGRFVCGWGCHIVALQDLCSHWMSRLGIRPRPWRTRLLLWCPLLLALYMFVYPTFERLALIPLLNHFAIPRADWPFFITGAGRPPHFHNALMTKDFWATFPDWYIAIPFLLVCGFATVYFLGSKAFCSFGCPYGGFFGVIDRFSVGRIVVSDACHQCGHCTAACTSNVRVHQEVHDFGMVVDPGCMKCLDCVSVCPNQALSFSFAKPAAFTRAKPKAPRTPRPALDLSWPEEIIIFALTIALFISFRGMLNQVPMLMAAGLAMIAGFGAWKLWRLTRDQNVRAQNLQLKLKGRLTRAGYVVAALFFLLLASGTWSGWVRLTRLRADLADAKVLTPDSRVMAPNYTPTPADKALAQRAIDLYLSTAPLSQGGYGWSFSPDQLARLAWLSAVAGDLPSAENYLQTSIAIARPSNDVVFGLVQFMSNRGATARQVQSALANIVTKYPEQVAARLTLARVHAAQGLLSDSVCEALNVSTSPRASIADIVGASELLVGTGHPDQAARILADAANAHPGEPLIEASLGRALYFCGYKDAAIAHMARAAALAPDNPAYWGALSELLDDAGRRDEAAAARKWIDTVARAQSNQGR